MCLLGQFISKCYTRTQFWALEGVPLPATLPLSIYTYFCLLSFLFCLLFFFIFPFIFLLIFPFFMLPFLHKFTSFFSYLHNVFHYISFSPCFWFSNFSSLDFSICFHLWVYLLAWLLSPFFILLIYIYIFFPFFLLFSSQVWVCELPNVFLFV